MRSWAAQSSASSGSGGSEPDLQLVDLLEQVGDHARRVAADFAVAQRQVVEAVEEDREPLGAAEHVEEGVEAGGGRVLAQQALAELVPGAHPELLVGVAEQCLDAVSQALGGRPGGGEEKDAVGRDALLDQPREASCQGLGLARPGGAAQQQRALVVGDRALLGLGEGEHVPTLAGGRGP